MGTGAVSTFLLIRIMLLWTFMYKSLCELVSSFIPGIYIGAELLNRIAILRLTFWGAAKHFSKVAASFYIPTSSAQGFQFLCILANQHLLSVFLITDIWVDVKWHLASHCGYFTFPWWVEGGKLLCLFHTWRNWVTERLIKYPWLLSECTDSCEHNSVCRRQLAAVLWKKNQNTSRGLSLQKTILQFSKNEEGPFLCTWNELQGTLLVKKPVTGSCVQNEPTDRVTDTVMDIHDIAMD